MSQVSHAEADDVDIVLDCLAESRRRILIRCLANETTPVKTDTVAHWIGERERGPGVVDSARSQEVEDITVSILHHHLPKLAEADIVSHDTDRDTVREGPQFEKAHDYLMDVSRIR